MCRRFPTLTARQCWPRAAVAPDARYAVAWQGDGPGGTALDICLQQFGPAGERLGAAERVNESRANDQAAPWVDLTPAGDAVVLWQNYGQRTQDWRAVRRRLPKATVPKG